MRASTMKLMAALAVAGMAALGGCQGIDLGGSNSSGLAAEEATCTILLYTFLDSMVGAGAEGGDHKARAEYYKAQTLKDARWKGLFILSYPGYSQLCWGRYATAKDAAKNLKTAQSFLTPAKVKVFEKATILALSGQDLGPREWRLENAPGVYSVMVAVFIDNPESNYVGHRKFAVEYCKQLREQGKEAYYYHGATRSAVTVGSFPESAIQTIPQDDGTTRTVSSPRIQAVLKEFEYMAVNGRRERLMLPNERKRTFRIDPQAWDNEEAREAFKHQIEGYKVIEQKSYPVRIPRKADNVIAPPANDRPGDGQPR